MRALERWGLGVARRVGRGDQERGLSLVALGAAAAYFVSLFLPWASFNSGWNFRTADDSGLLGLGLVLVELLRLSGNWTTRAAVQVAFCLTAGAGIMGVSTFATLEWGSGLTSTSLLRYGVWLNLAFALVLVAIGLLRLAALWRSTP